MVLTPRPAPFLQLMLPIFSLGLGSSIKDLKTVSAYSVCIRPLGQRGCFPIFTNTPDLKRSSCGILVSSVLVRQRQEETQPQYTVLIRMMGLFNKTRELMTCG